MSGRTRLLVGAIVVGVVLGVLGVAATGLFAALVDVDNAYLTREPQVVLDADAYVGAFSSLGALVWWTAVAVALLAAVGLRNRARWVFAAGGVLSAAMVLDDLFLLHDAFYPQLGIPETLVQGAYLAGIAIIGLWGRAELGLGGLLGFAVTVGFWGLSVVMDTFLNDSALNLDQLVEDGAKFVGIVVWSTTWAVLAHLALRDRARV